MCADNGTLKVQGPTGYATAGTPTIALPTAHRSEFNFYAVTYDCASGGRQTENSRTIGAPQMAHLLVTSPSR
jgi:hypothetical protein